MVLLDVVYNHFGPDGNYLHAYAPQFFTERTQTPWGAAINFDGPAAPRCATSSSTTRSTGWRSSGSTGCAWTRCTPSRRLRRTSSRKSPPRCTRRPGPRAPRAPGAGERRNDARFRRGPAPVKQWNDPLHHALHVLLTGEADGYYAPFAAAPLERLAEALAAAPGAHVAFLQNHDQIGNRALGERLHRLADPAREAAALACVLLAPQAPLLFMGEEWAASTPFLFFCDHAAGLARAVREGRRAEFARFAAFADAAARSRIPDPNARATFSVSKLDWRERERSPHRERLALVTRLLALRRERLAPRLAGAAWVGAEITGDLLRAQWALGDRSRLEIALDLAGAPPPLPGEEIYAAPHVRVALRAR
jgi:maltooligosyltrehalose trehalohydrolase